MKFVPETFLVCSRTFYPEVYSVVFCTPWPEGLETDEECEKHFPITLITRDYVKDHLSVRDKRARIITYQVQCQVCHLSRTLSWLISDSSHNVDFLLIWHILAAPLTSHVVMVVAVFLAA